MANLGGFQSSSSINNDKQGFNDENPENSISKLSIFSTDYKKHDDLKQMLDSNKDNLKLEAMKRIIGMIAKNKDASDLFPAVVKNVVSKNMEVKKLVYVFLMRYAEEQQDLALLSISTFQRALKDPNPLIRASALRVLSSIRVPIIVTIMMLAIKEGVNDMSPYVRKTAANAIAKLYSLDPEQKEDLVGIIEKLLADKTVLVAGSAIQAFEEVCPERIDLIHKNFRKLCNMVVDVDEWGQVIIVNMLTRYARTQFVDPNSYEVNDKDKKIVESDNDDAEDDETPSFVMNPDHRLLLRSMKPLLQSRNSSVVMAVAQLYYYLAPRSEIQLVAKSLIRLLRSYREVQIVVLKNIVTVAQKHRTIFEPHLKSFYVHSNDSIHIKLLKLEILTCLASESNISIILREFQTYVLSNDREFAAATVHAIGRCASTINEVTEACLNGLVSLMSKKDEAIVAESVVVIKRLLQLNPSRNDEIIKHMAKIIDKVTVPMARASILWLIGENAERIPKIAPDVLRKMAKMFCDEEDIVKLQTLNLAVKLYIINPKQTNLLMQYVLNLARYDQNYDIRDRARFLKALILNNEKCPNLNKHSKKLLLASKPAPLLESAYKNSDQFQLGTLSHAINMQMRGYKNLPSFPSPENVPDPTSRNVHIPTKEDVPSTKTGPPRSAKANKKLEEKFYSDDDNKSLSTEGPDPTSADNSDSNSQKKDSGSSSDSSSDSDSDSSSDSSSSDSEVQKKQVKQSKKRSDDELPVTLVNKNNSNRTKKSVTASSSSTSSSSTSSSSEESESEEEGTTKKKSNQVRQNITKKSNKEASLLDLDFNTDFQSSNKKLETKNALEILSPTLASDLKSLTEEKTTSFNENYISKKTYELLSKMNGNGLQIQYRFTRNQNASSNKMTNIELMFNNHTNSDINSIAIINKKDGQNLTNFTPLSVAKNSFMNHAIAIDFNDTTTPVQLDLSIDEHKKYNLSICCPPGELLFPYHLSENEFDGNQNKLKGMNELTSSLELNYTTYTSNLHNLKTKVLEIANMCQIPSSNQNVFKFAASTVSSRNVLLLTVKLQSEHSSYSSSITINCEKPVLANMILKEIKQVVQA